MSEGYSPEPSARTTHARKVQNVLASYIRLIEAAQPGSLLLYAQNIVGTLNEINRYAGQFHHDTNPAADQVKVVAGELRIYVQRALMVIHREDI